MCDVSRDPIKYAVIKTFIFLTTTLGFEHYCQILRKTQDRPSVPHGFLMAQSEHVFTAILGVSVLLREAMEFIVRYISILPNN